MYGSLKRLIEKGLIAESGERPAPELDDARRRYYKLTPLGRQVLDLESQRLKDLVRVSMQDADRKRDHERVRDGCGRAYRRIARAFPHQYRAICGDGLEPMRRAGARARSVLALVAPVVFVVTLLAT